MHRSSSRAVALFSALAVTCAFAQAPLPASRKQGDVAYVSGGVGADEVQSLKAAVGDYSLGLTFSRGGGNYIADVAVVIRDGKGATVFDAPAVGPYLLVKLPDGAYTVAATYQNETKTAKVAVHGAARSFTSLQWR